MSGNSKSEHLEKMFSLCVCILEQWNIFLDQYLSSNSTTKRASTSVCCW